MRVTSKVGVGARCVVWTAVGQGECMPMHCGRDIGLRSPVAKVSVPLLVAGVEMLHLKDRRTPGWSDSQHTSTRCLPL